MNAWWSISAAALTLKRARRAERVAVVGLVDRQGIEAARPPKTCFMYWISERSLASTPVAVPDGRARPRRGDTRCRSRSDAISSAGRLPEASMWVG